LDKALQTTACLTDPAVTGGQFDLDLCPSVLEALSQLNAGATEVEASCEPACAQTFAGVRPAGAALLPLRSVCMPCVHSCARRQAGAGLRRHPRATVCGRIGPQLARRLTDCLGPASPSPAAQLGPDCLSQLTDAFEADTSTVGVVGSGFLAECAAGGTADGSAPAPAPGAAAGRRMGRL
jgi:hypothetical protein